MLRFETVTRNNRQLLINMIENCSREKNECEIAYKYLFNTKDIHCFLDKRLSVYIKEGTFTIGFMIFDIKDEYYIMDEICIFKNYRHLGYGTRILEALFGMFPGTWLFSYDRSNGEACKFCEKMRELYQGTIHLVDESMMELRLKTK